MKDIIEKEVNDWDFVVCSFSHQGSDLRCGVWYNGSVYHLTNVLYGSLRRSPVKLVYKVENKSEFEQKLSEAIKDKIKAEIDMKERTINYRENAKRIPAKELVIGASYMTITGCEYIYLGKGVITQTYYEDEYVNETDYKGFICIGCRINTESTYEKMMNGEQGYYIPTVFRQRPFFVKKIGTGHSFEPEFEIKDSCKESRIRFDYKFKLDMNP